ncbi:acyl-CoA carboxylase subunit epsilon [Streptomyces sp. JNUCC 64]
MIKVVKGDPTPEELAAALAVVRARAAAPVTALGGPGPRSAWSDPARLARARTPAPGPSAWARTYWPG